MNTNNPLNPADFLEAPEVEDVSMTRARREYEELQENVISLSIDNVLSLQHFVLYAQ